MSHPDNDQTFHFDVAITVEGDSEPERWERAQMAMAMRLEEEREIGFNYYIDYGYRHTRRDA